MKLLKGVVSFICESATKNLNELEEHVARTAESQNLTVKEHSIKEFVVKKIKESPQFNLFCSERFSEIKNILAESIVYCPIIINFVAKGCEN